MRTSWRSCRMGINNCDSTAPLMMYMMVPTCDKAVFSLARSWSWVLILSQARRRFVLKLYPGNYYSIIWLKSRMKIFGVNLMIIPSLRRPDNLLFVFQDILNFYLIIFIIFYCLGSNSHDGRTCWSNLPEEVRPCYSYMICLCPPTSTTVGPYARWSCWRHWWWICTQRWPTDPIEWLTERGAKRVQYLLEIKDSAVAGIKWSSMEACFVFSLL